MSLGGLFFSMEKWCKGGERRVVGMEVDLEERRGAEGKEAEL